MGDEVIQLVYHGSDDNDGDDLGDVTEEQVEEARRGLEQAVAVARGVARRQELKNLLRETKKLKNAAAGVRTGSSTVPAMGSSHLDNSISAKAVNNADLRQMEEVGNEVASMMQTHGLEDVRRKKKKKSGRRQCSPSSSSSD